MRHGTAFIRHVLETFRLRQCSAEEAAGELDVTARRVRQLYRDYLRARACGKAETWAPGRSGGARRAAWSEPVRALVRALLTARPAASYSFAASEVHRRLGVRLHRASVRRWALRENLRPASRRTEPRAGLRRWQRSQIGSLWQLDVSPHAWFPDDPRLYPLFDMLDDCSRLVAGARIYPREDLMAYFDFLPRAFRAHGLPLALYVDYHSFFFTHDPAALTTLGSALKFYDISLLYAPTPQAKGKVERLHLYWQNRLPAFFAAEALRSPQAANPHLDELRRHHNAHETHREIQMAPLAAWKRALAEGRSVLRPAPRCPWWPYVFSLRKHLVVGSDGRVPVGSQRLHIPAPPHARVLQCRHPDGSITYLQKPPDPTAKPLVLLRWEPAGKL